MTSLTFLPPSNFAVFDCCHFLCYWLQRPESCKNCSNWPALSTYNQPNSYIRWLLLWVTLYANEQKCNQWRHDKSAYWEWSSLYCLLCRYPRDEILLNYLSNRKRFPCLHSLIKTQEGLGEFETVMQTRDEVEGLHNGLLSLKISA